MNAPALAWDEPALRRRLDAAWPGIALEVVAATASTNTDLLERARLGALAPCVRVAERQEGGRGRQGRTWQSAAGASLTFSVAVPLAATDWSGLSLAVGVALAEALDASGAPRIGVKWPNDLWLLEGPREASAPGGRKLGGILIESVASAAPRTVATDGAAAGGAPSAASGGVPAVAARAAVVGVGLNVRPFAVEGDEALRASIASLAEIEADATAPAVLMRAAPAVLEALRTFEAEGFAAFAARFAARDLLAGHGVRTTHPDAREGRAEGIGPQGALRVRTAGGDLVEVSSGEVSVRPC
jgi:BirA family biotin operon repressor/biotin-[acetyl-CoA-carboxylase] ligase